MSGFLHRLVARTIGQANVVRPRPIPRFAGTLDLPAAAYEDLARAASDGEGATAEPAGSTLLRGRPFTQREPAGDHVAAAIESLPDRSGVAQLSPAAFVAERDGTPSQPQLIEARQGLEEHATREELRLELESISTHGAGVRNGGEAARPSRVLAAREDTMIAQGVARADPIAADAIERRPPSIADAARTRRPPSFDSDDARPLAPTLAGPGTGVREAEALARGVKADRARLQASREPEATIVNVTIGRIEVRSAAEPATRIFRRETPATPQPRDQLDAYLRARGPRKR